MKITLLTLFLVIISIVNAQDSSSLASIEMSTKDNNKFFFIEKGEKIIYKLKGSHHKEKGIITAIYKDSIRLDSATIININELKSIISVRQKNFLHTKSWTTFTTGLILMTGGGSLLQSNSTIQKIIGGVGLIAGLPYLGKGIILLFEKKTCNLEKDWQINVDI